MDTKKKMQCTCPRCEGKRMIPHEGILGNYPVVCSLCGGTGKITKPTPAQLSMLRDISNIPGGRLPQWIYWHFTKTAMHLVGRMFDAGLLCYTGKHNDIVLTDAGRAILDKTRRLHETTHTHHRSIR